MPEPAPHPARVPRMAAFAVKGTDTGPGPDYTFFFRKYGYPARNDWTSHSMNSSMPTLVSVL
jgi:hypothetical protein